MYQQGTFLLSNCAVHLSCMNMQYYCGTDEHRAAIINEPSPAVLMDSSCTFLYCAGKIFISLWST